MTVIACDLTCPKCGHWETYWETADDGFTGCRKCGWRVLTELWDTMTGATRDAYLEALRNGHIYQASRGRYALSPTTERRYARRTIDPLREWDLVRWNGATLRWDLADTAAAQWVVLDCRDNAIVWYFPTEREAKQAMIARKFYTYAAPGYVPPLPAPEKVAVELTREDWKDVLTAFVMGAPRMAKGRHAEILTALTNGTTSKEN